MKNTEIGIGLKRSPPEIVAGIDEAGRGSLIGPLVICGVAIKSARLSEIEVRDSKKLTREKREKLYGEIMDAAEALSIRILSHEKIDSYRKKKTLNMIEVEIFSKVISDLISYTNTFYVDSADVDHLRFAQNISKLVDKDIIIISEHKADERYPVVSAASIVAKVTRDKIVENIVKEIGDFGSGYPSDQRTIEFIENWIKKHGSYPPYIRKSWKTAKRIYHEISREVKF